MSLKAFHIFFVIVSTVLSVGFGLWAVREYADTKEWVNLVMAVGGFAAGGVLVWYSGWFLRKLKNVSYL